MDKTRVDDAAPGEPSQEDFHHLCAAFRQTIRTYLNRAQSGRPEVLCATQALAAIAGVTLGAIGNPSGVRAELLKTFDHHVAQGLKERQLLLSTRGMTKQ